MERKLIADMHCPYCAGAFTVSHECEADAARIRYGLLDCRCFQFPIVDGVLLLSLNKGYGGAEEALQPYVPLQVAAIQHLKANDVAGLKAWIGKHIPLAAELIEDRAGAYLPFCARMNWQLALAESDLLNEVSRYEVIGRKRKLYNIRRRLGQFDPPKEDLPALLGSYFVGRFFAPRINTLAMQIGQLPMNGRVLSLCCGQGVFENLLAVDGRNRELVCLDGQFLNLLVTRQYIAPKASFICHDVQFALPFNDGSFDGVFSSTCLPEIPVQRTFAREAIRVTRNSGWTFFDSIWGLANAVNRIDGERHYRFCQNFFTHIQDYLPFFDSCMPASRSYAIDIPSTPDRYVEGPRWISGDARAPAVAAGDDTEISVLVTDAKHFTGFTPAARPWLNAQQLAVSPAFEATREADGIRLQLRERFANLTIDIACKAVGSYPPSAFLESAKADDAAWLQQQFNASLLCVLPSQFDDAVLRL